MSIIQNLQMFHSLKGAEFLESVLKLPFICPIITTPIFITGKFFFL